MIVIFCTADEDYANRIIEWLNHSKCPFVKIDLFEESAHNLELSLIDNEILFYLNNGQVIRYSEVSFFFYRSGNLQFKHQHISNCIMPAKLQQSYLRLEFDGLLDYVYRKIQEKSLGWINQKPLNKLVQLDIAQQCGIAIPDTHILNSKKRFEEKIGEQKVITKAIQENVGSQDEGAIYLQRVGVTGQAELPGHFFPSLFQEKIEKLLEIRTFYLDGAFYSIAFENRETRESIDMRDNYSNHIYFKCDLPAELEKKLDTMMRGLDLKSGSIDLIYAASKTYYFLEVNPEGQYEWVSVFGAYNLDKKIADYLVEKQKMYEKAKG